MAFRPPLKVDFDRTLVDKLFNDLANAPIVDCVLGVNIVCHRQQLAIGK